MAAEIGVTFDKELKQRIFLLNGDRPSEYSLYLGATSTNIYTGNILYLTGSLIRNSEGVSGETITIYQGDTQIAQVTTESDGSFSEDVENLEAGTYQFKAMFGYDESNTLNVTVMQSVLTITTSDVSKTYRAGTKFYATVLFGGQPYGEGEYVTFTIGGNSYDRQIGNDGKATLNLPFNVGIYTITSSYGGVTNTNTITITKSPTTTTATASASEITAIETLTISGTITGNYTDMTGNVRIYDGSTLMDTVSVSSGTYSCTLDTLAVGSHLFWARYVGDSNYDTSDSSTVSVTVTEAHNYALSLTGDSIIESGSDATITATVTDGGTAVSGVTLNYQIKHGSTTISSGTTSQTNSQGKATIDYTGTGVGDVDVIVSHSGMSLQETYTIEDLVYYNTNEYSSQSSLNISLPSTFTIEFDVKPTSRTSASAFVGLGTSTTNQLIVGQMTSAGSCGVRNRTNNSYTTQQAFTTSSTLNSDNHFKLTFDGTDWIAYYGSETLTNSKPSAYDLSKLVEVYPTSNCKLKNIKIKAL